MTEGSYVGNILEEHFHRTHNSESKVGRDEHSGGTELRLLTQAPDQSNDLADFGRTQSEYKLRVARINELLYTLGLPWFPPPEDASQPPRS